MFQDAITWKDFNNRRCGIGDSVKYRACRRTFDYISNCHLNGQRFESLQRRQAIGQITIGVTFFTLSD